MADMCIKILRGRSDQKVSPLARILLGARTPGQAREALWAYVFLLPWLLGLILFFGGPILASLVLSLFDYSLIKPPVFVGLGNLRKAFTDDALFWPSLGRTFRWAMMYVPPVVAGSLFLAILLNQKLKGTSVFRTLFFLPHLTPAVSLAVLWTWILNPLTGPVNYILGEMGLPQPAWLTSEAWAMRALLIMAFWGGLGGNRLLIFLAGLQGVPQELYEAAEIDGAGAWAKFRHVTMPMISPVILFNVLLAFIGALKVFTTAYVATKGGPNYATWFLALHIFNQAFNYFRFGYGAALAWLLAIILVIFSYVQMRLSSRWVYAAGE